MKRRRHSHRDCDGKEPFKSRKRAEKIAGKIAKRDGLPMHVYGCSRCRCLHIGSSIIPQALRHG